MRRRYILNRGLLFLSVLCFAWAIYHPNGIVHKDAVVLGLLLFVTSEIFEAGPPKGE